MKKLLGAALVGVLVAGPVFADSACYSPVELRAEHLLRLHSELMVVTVTCQVGSHGEDLVAGYTGFTNQHIKALHEAERSMTAYYNKHGGNGEDRTDRLRTKLGNEFGQKIVDMGSAQAFCDKYRDKVLVFANVSGSTVQNEVERMEIADKSYVAPCTIPSQAIKAASGR